MTAMTAANRNFIVEQGALFQTVLTLRDEAGEPMDLTDCTARMQIRPRAGDATLLHELSTSNGGITIDGPAGTVTLTIPPATSLGFTWSSGEYDLVLTDAAGEPVRVLKGRVMVDPAVTR